MKHELASVAGLVGVLLFAPAAAAQAVHGTVWGWYTHADFGHAVAHIGDIDKDGYQDYVVGAPKAWGPAGFGQGGGFVVSSRNDMIVRSHQNGPLGSRGGAAVAAGFDVDGDGEPDYAIGYPDAPVGALDAAGFVMVYSGKTGAVLRTLSGNVAGGRLGESIAFVGDVNGDGVPDIAVGAPQTAPAGAVRIFSGATGAQLATSSAAAPLTLYGSRLTAVGDWNGDGRGDMAVSGFDTVAQVGVVRVVSAWNGALLHESKATTQAGGFGRAIVSLADVDGDGRRELLIGAPFEGVGGVVRLMGSASKQALVTVHGQHAGGSFGHAIAAVGDLDGDGRADFVVTSAAATEAMRVVSSVTGQTIGAPLAKPSGSTQGASVAAVGDVDGDGWLDLVLGEPTAVMGPNVLGATRVVRLAHHQPNLGYHSTQAQLSIHGYPLFSGGWADLRVSQTEAHIGGVLVLSPWWSPVPFGAGTLVPTLDGILMPFVTDANGVYTIKGIPGGLGQFSLYCQAALKTTEPTPAIRFSNVIRADFLP